GTDSISLSAIRRAPESPLFPYTTLFRSIEDHHDVDLVGVVHPLEVMLLVSPPGTLPLEDDPLSGSALLDHVRPCHRLDLEVVVLDRKSTRLNSSHVKSSYAVFCLKKKNP